MPYRTSAFGLDVIHDRDDCPEAIRHGDSLDEVTIAEAADAINAGSARPCGSCIGRAPNPLFDG